MHPDDKRPRLKLLILRLFWSQSPHARSSCSKVPLVLSISNVPHPRSMKFGSGQSGLLLSMTVQVVVFSSLCLFHSLSASAEELT